MDRGSPPYGNGPTWTEGRRPLPDEAEDRRRRERYWKWNASVPHSDDAMALWDLDERVSWHLVETAEQADFEAFHMRHSVGYDFDHYSDVASPTGRIAFMEREAGGIFSLRRGGIPFATALLVDGAVVHAVGVANAVLTEEEHGWLAKVSTRARWKLADRHSLAGMVRPSATRDGDRHFTARAMDEADEESASAMSRETKVYMTPREFLDMAEVGWNEAKGRRTKEDYASNGGAFSSVPSLRFENLGDGTARVVGHEGRHRSTYLIEAGVEEMPVRLRCVGGAGGSVRWGIRGTDRDMVESHPHTLVGEDGRRSMPMPRSVVFPDPEPDVEEASGPAR